MLSLIKINIIKNTDEKEKEKQVKKRKKWKKTRASEIRSGFFFLFTLF